MTGLSRFDFYPRDWISGTRELTPAARGVYIDTIARMYDLGRPLDYDLRDLCRFLAIRDRRGLKPILKELFDKDKIHLTDDGKISNRRFEIEMQKVAELVANGRLGGRGRRRETGSRTDSGGTLEAPRSEFPDAGSVQNQAHNQKPPSPSPSPSNKKYAFSGKVVRLTESDFKTWETSYSHLGDLRGLLQNRDDWLADQGDDVKRDWFRRTSNWLRNLNEQAAQRAVAAKPRSKIPTAGTPEADAQSRKWGA